MRWIRFLGMGMVGGFFFFQFVNYEDTQPAR